MPEYKTIKLEGESGTTARIFVKLLEQQIREMQELSD